ncbi:hypothetical protein RFI_21078 [Reticulomyxa filosa]|uniref:Viral A-type inclusion protein n=1 Tax=Reticulomyxa filosa TaxID=46433 RepID=X6MQY7_RETFI|nr:hypothetical protein RFI_21078 [Reticulomyxa filosa]|eukprot:ETO16274.1 hypothetical protein RFI_21078 [Reticulomyxa filosa]
MIGFFCKTSLLVSFFFANFGGKKNQSLEKKKKTGGLFFFLEKKENLRIASMSWGEDNSADNQALTLDQRDIYEGDQVDRYGLQEQLDKVLQELEECKKNYEDVAKANVTLKNSLNEKILQNKEFQNMLKRNHKLQELNNQLFQDMGSVQKRFLSLNLSHNSAVETMVRLEHELAQAKGKNATLEIECNLLKERNSWCEEQIKKEFCKIKQIIIKIKRENFLLFFF